MMDLRISFDPAPLVETLSGLRDAIPVVQTRVVNRSMTTAHAFAARELARSMGLSNKTIRAGLKVDLASFARPFARMQISGARLPLKMFRPKRDRLGIRAMMPDGPELFRGAFWATMPLNSSTQAAGHRGIFQRVTSGPGSRPAKRYTFKDGKKVRTWLPIREIFTWSRARTFTEIGTIAEDTQRVALEALVKNLRADVRYALKRRRT